MIRVIDGKNIQSHFPVKTKWLDTFIKLHNQKKDIVSTSSQNISNRIANFEHMIQLTKFSSLKKSKSTNLKNAQSSVGKMYNNSIQIPACVTNFLMMTSKNHSIFTHKQIQQNKQIDLSSSTDFKKGIEPQHQMYQNQFSETAQMKKLNKMVLGISQYDQYIKERQKIERQKNQRNKLKKQNINTFNCFQNQNNKQQLKLKRSQIKTALSRGTKSYRSFQKINKNNYISLSSSMAKTQKQWHALKRVQIKIQNNNLFMPINASNQINQFKSLKNKVKTLENKAKYKFGMNFDKNHESSPCYVNQIQQLHDKSKYLESNFIKRDPQIILKLQSNTQNKNKLNKQMDQYDNLIQECDQKIDDSTIPKFLLQNKKINRSQIKCSKIGQNRAKSSILFQKSYIRML